MQTRKRCQMIGVRTTTPPWVALGMSALLLAGAGCTTTPRRTGSGGQITQWAVYRPAGPERPHPTLTLSEALRHGDSGLGFLDPLDGELVIEKGKGYQIRADGNVHHPPPTARLGTAIVYPFRLDRALRMPADASLEAFKRALDELAPDAGALSTFRLVGRFDWLEVSAPTPSRLPLVGLTRRKRRLERVSGVITGMRLPESAPGLHAPGLHMVFLSHDRLNGGRVSDFALLDGTLEVHLPDRLLYIQP